MEDFKKLVGDRIRQIRPEALKIFSDLVKGVKSMEASLTIQKRNKKK